MKIYFYHLIDPRTNEIKYIGQTKNLKSRLANHIWSASKAKDKREYNSKKCGWIRELLSLGMTPLIKEFEIFKGSPENAHRREWELIVQYIENGYDLLNGNDGGIPYYISDERVRKVYQYDKNNLEFIKEFRTMYDAYTETGIKDSNIGRSCKSIDKLRVRFAGGFLWSFEKYDIFPKEKLIFSERYNKKKIVAINIESKITYIFDSARKAAKELNCSYKQISACCLGVHKAHNGYIFKFEKDIV